ncbi:conserved protein of unknown function [Tenacibaculum sp. 190130A14a]|uniref:tRNA_anti-like n=1 Tax=Tenacibaculum polynesiense TaxID=3137857 RepID=A0ABM9PB55_9FLAO
MNFPKKNKRRLFYSVILFLLGFYLVFNYVVFKPHKTTAKVKSVFVGKASSFIDTIQKEGIKPWLNKMVTLKGKVDSKDNFGLVLRNGIYCQFKKQSDIGSVQLNQEVYIKGQIIGYDDLLEELKLNYCIIKNIQHD